MLKIKIGLALLKIVRSLAQRDGMEVSEFISQSLTQTLENAKFSPESPPPEGVWVRLLNAEGGAIIGYWTGSRYLPEHFEVAAWTAAAERDISHLPAPKKLR